MKPLSKFIEESAGRYSAVTAPLQAFSVVADSLRARRDEIDASWHLPSMTAERWAELRTRRAQLSEDIDLLEAFVSLASGKPIVNKAIVGHRPTEAGYAKG